MPDRAGFASAAPAEMPSLTETAELLVVQKPGLLQQPDIFLTDHLFFTVFRHQQTAWYAL